MFFLGGNNIGPIVGGVLGAVIVLTLILILVVVVLLLLFMKGRKRPAKDTQGTVDVK